MKSLCFIGFFFVEMLLICCFDFLLCSDWVSVATWRWIANDDNCGICRMPFESCCTECTLPGDDCPLGKHFLSILSFENFFDFYLRHSTHYQFQYFQFGVLVRIAFTCIASSNGSIHNQCHNSARCAGKPGSLTTSDLLPNNKL